VSPTTLTSEDARIEALVQRANANEPLSESEKQTVDRYYQDLSEQMDAEHGRGGSLDTTSGPDAYGYWYTDNSGNGTPPDSAAYSWIELAGDANATRITAIDESDYGISGIPLPWSFNYYGRFR
jgi:hypothetical protein